MNCMIKKSKIWFSALTLLGTIALNGCGSSGNGDGNGSGGFNPGGIPNGTCQSLSSPIPFTANNILIDSSNVVGGRGLGYGQIVVGGSYSAGPFNGVGPDGDSISMNIPGVTPGSPFPYYFQPNVTSTGVIQVGATAQREIIEQFYGYYQTMQYPNNNYYNSGSLCVYEVSLDLGFIPSQSDLYGGYVYLFLRDQNNPNFGSKYAVLYF